MIRSGLVSVTFRKLAPVEIVALVREAGGAGIEWGIEWGGDVHVPHGDLGCARAVREMTEQAGLQVAAYGSYYRVGRSEDEALPFERVLETAIELGAPTIRVWPGIAGSAATPDNERGRIVQELRRIGGLAESARIEVALEFHGGTLTDTNASAIQLMAEVAHSNVRTLWQPHLGEETPAALAGLRELLPKVGNVHVFHWAGLPPERRSLVEGEERWAEFLRVIRQASGNRFALIEFVQNDDPAAYLRDAAILQRWLAVANREVEA